MCSWRSDPAAAARASLELAKLRGIRLAAASEGEAGQRLATAQMKTWTGEDTVSAREMYKSGFTFVPQFKIWDGGLTVIGSRGQSALHPAVRALQGLGGAIKRLADRFGCSPAARTRLGLDAAGTLAHEDAEDARVAALLDGDDE